ncbi:hypothetical protein D3C81_2045460 [compost metagenome]
MSSTKGRSHIRERPETPSNGKPNHCRKNQAAQNVGPQGVAHNTLNEVSSHIIALAHPNPHTVAFVFQHESAPIPIVQIHDIAETGLAR